jgi:hypothetical protein
VAGALVVGFLAFEWSRRYFYNVCDDTLISLQYARNAAEGLGLVFNPGERVEGYTNFLWVALLTVLHPLSDGTSFGFVRLATTLSIVFAALDVLLVYLLGRLIWQHRVLPAACAIGLCVLDNAYTVWAMQALEAHLLIFTMLLACLFLWGGTSLWNAIGAALSLAAAMMTRPDAALFVMVLGASELLWAWSSDEKKKALRRVLAIFGTTGLVYGAYFLWRYDYFGYLMPNTYYVKAAGLRTQAIERGALYVQGFLFERGYVPLLALTAVVGLRNRIVGPLFVWALLHTAYVVYVGGDFYPGHRFLVVVIPVGALLIAYTLDRAVSWAHTRWSSSRRVTWGGWAVASLLVAAVAVLGLRMGPAQTEVNRWGKEVQRVRALMEWLGEQAPPGASIMTGDIGSSGFYANLYVHDFLGVIDPIVAHQERKQLGKGKAGHEKHADPDYLLAKRPTYIKRGYIHRDLYRYGYYFDADLPPRLNEPGIWRRDELFESGAWEETNGISFESRPYLDWSASGEAFERWPVRHPARGQGRPVGQRNWFVSSYHETKGDHAVGRLRSAPFVLEGDLLTLRVAGGRDSERLKVELQVNGEVAYSATGHDSEIFARHVWDISGLRGSSAIIQIVDDAQGAWGHIMVDEIQQWTRATEH